VRKMVGPLDRLTGGDEGVPALGEDLHEVVGEVAAGQVQAHDGVGQRVTLVHRHVVGHTVPGVQHDTWGRQAHPYCSSLLLILPYNATVHLSIFNKSIRETL